MGDLGDIMKYIRVADRPDPWPNWTRQEKNDWEKRRRMGVAGAAYILAIGLARRRIIPLDASFDWDKTTRQFFLTRRMEMLMQAGLWGWPRKRETLEPIPRLRAMLTNDEWEEMRRVAAKHALPPEVYAAYRNSEPVPEQMGSKYPRPAYFYLVDLMEGFALTRVKQLRRGAPWLPPPSMNVQDQLDAV